MAIDDNTSYELTGAQVKDLASKIKAKADSSSLATVATTGNYNDLTNQPTIPTVNDATLTIQQNGTSVGTFTANASSNATISLTDTTYSTMTGATSGAAGTSGLVPSPAAGDNGKYLKGDGTWGSISASGATIIYSDGSYLYSDQAMTTALTGQNIYDLFASGGVIVRRDSHNYCSEIIHAYKNGNSVQFVLSAGNYGQDFATFYFANASSTNKLDYSVNLQQKLTAGSNISISNNTISATVPTVNDGTLTIQHNGTSKGTFTANQSSASTVNIETIYAVDISSTQPVDWTTILNKFHPVGSIYMSATLSTAAQVEAAIGGTWVAWGAGRVPVGVDTSQTEFDTAEETGGEKTHTLTVDEMPSHQHRERGYYRVQGGVSGGDQVRSRLSLSADVWDTSMEATGGGQSHNNLQPYITCYMYKRTA